MQVSPRYDGPVILTIGGSPDDQRDTIARQRLRLCDLVDELSDAQLAMSTRCSMWSAREVVAHLIGVNQFWERSIALGVAGTPTRFTAGFDPAATPPLMVAGMSGLGRADLVVAHRDSCTRLLAAVDGLSDEQWSMPAESPMGHVPVRIVAMHALWDCWVHERDIALPLGLSTAEEPDEVAACLRFAAGAGPAFGFAVGSPFTGRFALEATDPDVALVIEVGASVVVSDGVAPEGTPTLSGRAVDLVETLSMRRPLPVDAPAAWRTFLTGLGSAFDAPLAATP